MLIALAPMTLFAIILMLALLHLVDHVIANSQSPVYPFKGGKGKAKKQPRQAIQLSLIHICALTPATTAAFRMQFLLMRTKVVPRSFSSNS